MHLFPQFSKVIVTPQKPFDEEQFYFGRTKVDNNGSSQEEAYTHTCLRDACAICVCFSFRFIDQRRAKRKIKRMASGNSLDRASHFPSLSFSSFSFSLSLSLFRSNATQNERIARGFSRASDATGGVPSATNKLFFLQREVYHKQFCAECSRLLLPFPREKMKKGRRVSLFPRAKDQFFC